jgi:hypothetical protein
MADRFPSGTAQHVFVETDAFRRIFKFRSAAACEQVEGYAADHADAVLTPLILRLCKPIFTPKISVLTAL